jgi:hypothetical protein
MRLIPIFAVLLLIFGVAGSTDAAFRASAQGSVLRSTAAWRDRKFNIDVRVVLARSNIILQRPNLQREELMPLGNGRLGTPVSCGHDRDCDGRQEPHDRQRYEESWARVHSTGVTLARCFNLR